MCVAPDLVLLGDICLGGCCCGVMFAAFKCSSCAEHVLGQLSMGILCTYVIRYMDVGEIGP